MKTTFRFSTADIAKSIRDILQENRTAKIAALNDVAHFLRSEVQKRTPVDEGTLTNDIATSVIEFGKSTATAIFVPSNAPSKRYAIPMHEHTYNIGKKSLGKQRRVGALVGKGYITRAISDNFPKLRQIILYRLRRELGI